MSKKPIGYSKKDRNEMKTLIERTEPKSGDYVGSGTVTQVPKKKKMKRMQMGGGVTVTRPPSTPGTVSLQGNPSGRPRTPPEMGRITGTGTPSGRPAPTSTLVPKTTDGALGGGDPPEEPGIGLISGYGVRGMGRVHNNDSRSRGPGVENPRGHRTMGRPGFPAATPIRGGGGVPLQGPGGVMVSPPRTETKPRPASPGPVRGMMRDRMSAMMERKRGMKGGGLARKGVGMALAKGGLVNANGCAARGKTKGKMV